MPKDSRTRDGLELVDTLQRERRDATEAELADEPDAVLSMLARGELGATPTTADLARRELGRRELAAHARRQS